MKEKKDKAADAPSVFIYDDNMALCPISFFGKASWSAPSVLGLSTGHFIVFYLPKRHPSGEDFCGVISKLGGISGVIAPFESTGGVCPRVKEMKAQRLNGL